MERLMSLFALFALVNATPILQRCFSGGQLITEKTSPTAISEFCLKDDVSIIKSVVEYDKVNNSIVGTSKVYRQWVVSDWKLCHPVKTEGGSINVIEVDKELTIKSNAYVCTTDCTISIDKENAQVIFQTSRLNHFEVSGTTQSTGWFKTKASVSLDQTCEHIRVSCGKKSLQFHACFKQHMPCVRFLHRNMLPGQMAISICQNIELIIILTLTLLIFIVLNIIAKTYICYLMLPLYIPFAYFYGWLYNKSCKICNNCGLAYHPFTNCGSICVCGTVFQTSDRMRMHREGGMCKGYKSLIMARILCKAKTSSLVISIISALLILSFVTPIEGLENDQLYKLSNLPQAYTDEISKLEFKIYRLFVISIINMVITGILLVIAILSHFITNRVTRSKVFLCKECNMYHTLNKIRYNGDFCNKCGTCTCGVEEDPNYTTMHKVTDRCLSDIKRKIQKKMMIFLILIVLIENTLCVASTDEHCFKEKTFTVDCIGPLINKNQCAKKTISEIGKELISSNHLASSELEKLDLIPTGSIQAWEMIDNQINYKQMFLLEYAFLMRECSYFKEFEHNSGPNQITWRMIAKTEHFDICAIRSNQMFCRCMSDSSHCKNSNWDFADEMNSIYSGKSTFYEHDVKLFTRIFKAAFHGTTSHTYELFLEKHNSAGLCDLFKKLASRFPYNNLMVGLLKFGEKLMSMSFLKDLPKANKGRTTTPRTENNYVDLSNAKVGEPTPQCIDLKLLNCISPRFQIPAGSIVKCGTSEIKLYDFHTPVYKYTSEQTTWCKFDKHCLHNWDTISQERLAAVKKLRCWYTNPSENQDIYSASRKSCKLQNKGTCVINGNSYNVLQCDDNQVFYTDHNSSPDTQGDIGEYCISANCGTVRYPLNIEASALCTWEYNTVKPMYLQRTNLRTLEEYKRTLQDKLSHNLEVFHFEPTKNYPHILPAYKYITANGVENADGIEGAYITTELPAISGTSVGLNIISKDNINLMDIIIYIKSSTIKSTYNHIYDTGPTININVKHDELCTGSCPRDIPHQAQWLTFSQERTSKWGCEEFGCLAIGEGCVFGSCQDVIKKEMRVYKKSTEELNEVYVCILFAEKDYCINLNALEPQITPNIELQLETLDTKMLPSIIGLSNHKIYSGQINDLGSFSQLCGNVQQVNKTIYGAGQPKFDYLCHSAKRKDIIVRKCFNNNYGSCKLLPEEKDLILEDNYNTVNVINNKHNLGILKIKVNLGDIRYKLFSKKPEFEAEAHCVGCVGCFSNYDCEIKIESTIDVNCPIIGDCDFSHNFILINPAVNKYVVKMICKIKPQQNSELTLCKKKIPVIIDTVEKHDKIEINVGDQTSYIREKDAKCGTWLCRVMDEGIGVIFEPLKALFGGYLHIGFIIIIIICVLFLGIYIFLPMIMKIRDILKENEIAYQKEMKLK
uniref:Envelopment polyprotein n=1 Tax=Orthobunyavirus wyeomyiae TaxID=3052456 RepID=L7QH00_9VIRU|nr:polyprotein [Orthobunyavirus wyeomyiae]AXP32083.1 glycoprotein precursor [Orthobunyavirus wyeomyiae]